MSKEKQLKSIGRLLEIMDDLREQWDEPPRWWMYSGSPNNAAYKEAALNWQKLMDARLIAAEILSPRKKDQTASSQAPHSSED